MIIEVPGAPYIDLEARWLALDGQVKPAGQAVVSSTVRVYHRGAGGALVVDLPPTAMVVDGSADRWRYRWVAPAVALGAYVVEYTAVDLQTAAGVETEDLVVHPLATKVARVYGALFGHQKLDRTANKLYLYDENDVLLATFDTKDAHGLPNTRNVHERIPI